MNIEDLKLDIKELKLNQDFSLKKKRKQKEKKEEEEDTAI